MPQWNLRDDWPREFMPRDATGATLEIFSMPLRSDVSIPGVDLETAGDGTKLLRIDLAEPGGADVLSMVPGRATFDAGRSRLTLATDIFTVPGIRHLVTDRSPADYPVAWFDHWITAGRVPAKIVYENVTDGGNGTFQSGQVIGRTAGPLGISIAYADSTDSTPRFMHPVEFFSLLFWQAGSDPCFNDDPTRPPLPADDVVLQHYDHPLLYRMLLLKEDGSTGTFADGDWLGLRPPLRTYKRIEWEARQTHVFHHDNWQKEGDLRGILRNPFIQNPGYAGFSKCNVFVGEMAFRAGFRTFTMRHSTGVPPIRYQTGGPLVAVCTDANCDGVNVRAASGPFDWRGSQYRINAPFGKKRHVEMANRDAINGEIANGKVIYFARKVYCRGKTAGGTNVADEVVRLDCPRPDGTTRARNVSKCPGSVEPCSDPDGPDHFHQIFHVFIVSHLGSISGTSLSSATRRLDQHCSRGDTPTGCNVGYCGYLDASARAFVELIPGGDPSEDWGRLDLNCIREVTP